MRQSACECERDRRAERRPGAAPAELRTIQAKLRHDAGRIARLVAVQSDDGQLSDELYLAVFARPPNQSERTTAVEYLSAADGDPLERRAKAEDLVWTMLNSLEFVFNH